MIREATVKDAAAIARIYNHYIRETTVTFEEDSCSEDDLVARIKKTQASGFCWLVAEDQGEIVGYAYSSEWRNRPAYRNTVEISVYVLHTLHSRGWGSRLYEALFSRLREASLHIAIGGITLPNQASIALHEKFGMEKIAHFRQVGFKFGEWLDVGYWQVQLDALDPKLAAGRKPDSYSSAGLIHIG